MKHGHTPSVTNASNSNYYIKNDRLQATVKKYLLKALAISWRSLIVFPSIFKVLISSVFPVLLVSRFATQSDNYIMRLILF